MAATPGNPNERAAGRPSRDSSESIATGTESSIRRPNPRGTRGRQTGQAESIEQQLERQQHAAFSQAASGFQYSAASAAPMPIVSFPRLDPPHDNQAPDQIRADQQANDDNTATPQPGSARGPASAELDDSTMHMASVEAPAVSADQAAHANYTYDGKAARSGERERSSKPLTKKKNQSKSSQRQPVISGAAWLDHPHAVEAWAASAVRFPADEMNQQAPLPQRRPASAVAPTQDETTNKERSKSKVFWSELAIQVALTAVLVAFLLLIHAWLTGKFSGSLAEEPLQRPPQVVGGDTDREQLRDIDFPPEVHAATRPTGRLTGVEFPESKNDRERKIRLTQHTEE